jgi:hypothetical protein
MPPVSEEEVLYVLCLRIVTFSRHDALSSLDQPHHPTRFLAAVLFFISRAKPRPPPPPRRNSDPEPKNEKIRHRRGSAHENSQSKKSAHTYTYIHTHQNQNVIDTRPYCMPMCHVLMIEDRLKLAWSLTWVDFDEKLNNHTKTDLLSDGTARD